MKRRTLVAFKIRMMGETEKEEKVGNLLVHRVYMPTVNRLYDLNFLLPKWTNFEEAKLKIMGPKKLPSQNTFLKFSLHSFKICTIGLSKLSNKMAHIVASIPYICIYMFIYILSNLWHQECPWKHLFEKPTGEPQLFR